MYLDSAIAKDDPKALATLEREPRSDERRSQILLMNEIHTKLKDYGQAIFFCFLECPLTDAR